jgi:hypothetical protein
VGVLDRTVATAEIVEALLDPILEITDGLGTNAKLDQMETHGRNAAPRFAWTSI